MPVLRCTNALKRGAPLTLAQQMLYFYALANAVGITDGKLLDTSHAATTSVCNTEIRDVLSAPAGLLGLTVIPSGEGRQHAWQQLTGQLTSSCTISLCCVTPSARQLMVL